MAGLRLFSRGRVISKDSIFCDIVCFSSLIQRNTLRSLKLFLVSQISRGPFHNECGWNDLQWYDLTDPQPDNWLMVVPASSSRQGSEGWESGQRYLGKARAGIPSGPLVLRKLPLRFCWWWQVPLQSIESMHWGTLHKRMKSCWAEIDRERDQNGWGGFGERGDALWRSEQDPGLGRGHRISGWQHHWSWFLLVSYFSKQETPTIFVWEKF